MTTQSSLRKSVLNLSAVSLTTLLFCLLSTNCFCFMVNTSFIFIIKENPTQTLVNLRAGYLFLVGLFFSGVLAFRFNLCFKRPSLLFSFFFCLSFKCFSLFFGFNFGLVYRQSTFVMFYIKRMMLCKKD